MIQAGSLRSTLFTLAFPPTCVPSMAIFEAARYDPTDPRFNPMWRQAMYVMPFMARLGVTSSWTGWSVTQLSGERTNFWTIEGVAVSHILFGPVPRSMIQQTGYRLSEAVRHPSNAGWLSLPYLQPNHLHDRPPCGPDTQQVGSPLASAFPNGVPKWLAQMFPVVYRAAWSMYLAIRIVTGV